MAVYDFQSNFNKSNSDSYYVMEYFKSLGYEIDDYTEDLNKQMNEGVDFGIRENKNDFQKVEFKSCSRINKTGNLAYEIIANFMSKKLGSCLSTTAKFLFYYDNVQKILHVLDIVKLNNVIKDSRITKWEVAKASTYKKNGNTYCSFSLLIPVKFLESNQDKIKYQVYYLNNQ